MIVSVTDSEFTWTGAGTTGLPVASRRRARGWVRARRRPARRRDPGFLFEFCHPECYRDAHFMDPDNPGVGSRTWVSGRPFHVRHGFISDGDQPLGDGFDVAMYVTLWNGSVEAEARFLPGQTYRVTSDYVMRGTSEQCGPTYKTQTGPASCEWFVHDFPEGLPDGRYDLWTVWEAPCSAWMDLAFTAACSDPNQVVSFFSSGVNMPFDQSEPSFTEPNQAQLTASQLNRAKGAGH